MRKYIKALIVVLILIAPLNIHAKAAESTVTINELIENAKEYDGKEVIVQGEAIGEPMVRGKYVWINLNDTSNAIGIWTEKTEADKVLYYGNYQNIGDTIKIDGIFQRACKEHGGEADLHCKSLSIVKVGHPVREEVSVLKSISAVVLIIIALLLFFIYRRTVKNKL